MAASRSSSERTGSIQSQDSPKTSLQTKADPNMALYEAQPSKLIKSLILCPVVHLLISTVAVINQPGHRDQFSLRNMQHRDRDGKIIGTSTLSAPLKLMSSSHVH